MFCVFGDGELQMISHYMRGGKRLKALMLIPSQSYNEDLSKRSIEVFYQQIKIF